MGTISVSLPNDGDTIDAADYNTPLTTIVNVINGNLDNDNIKSAAGISGSKLADTSVDIGAKASVFDGWVAVSDSWAYASATTITVPSDATTKYSVGDKIKIVQSATTKYFDITAVASTVLTVRGVTTETVANSSISAIYYSKVKTPSGYPLNNVDWYQELGRTTLASSGDTISVTNIPARKYLRILVYAINSGQIIPRFQFNGDTTSSYAVRVSSNGGADSASTSQANIIFASSGSAPILGCFDVVNIAAQEKLITGGGFSRSTAGAGTAPARDVIVGKWTNTSDQITRVDVINSGTGDFASGSEVVVLGHD